MLGTQTNSPTRSGGSIAGSFTGATRPVSKYSTSMDSANKSAIPQSSGPIIAGNCISCMGMVRISHSMSVNATVRCPHCQELFLLADLLDQSLPPLEVVANPQQENDAEVPYIDTLHLKTDDSEDKADKPRVKFEIPKALKDGAKRKRRRRRRSRSSSEGGTSGSGGSGGSSAASPRSTGASSSSSGAGGDSRSAVAPAAGETFGEAVERRRARNGDRSSRSSHRGRVRSSASRAKEAATERSALGIAKIVAGVAVAVPIVCLAIYGIYKADLLGRAAPSSEASTNPVATSFDSDPSTHQEFPSYLDQQDEKAFAPEPIIDGGDRIAIPDIDPDEVFGQEFGL